MKKGSLLHSKNHALAIEAHVSYFADFAGPKRMYRIPKSGCIVMGVEGLDGTTGFFSDRAQPITAASDLGSKVVSLRVTMHLLQRNVKERWVELTKDPFLIGSNLASPVYTGGET